MLIEEYPEAVPVTLCERIIACFEQDPRRKASAVVVGGGAAAEHSVRSGTMLAIDRTSPAWDSLFLEVVPALRATVDAYIKKYPGLSAVVEWEGLDCTIPMIERVEPGQGFDWHYDNHRGANERVLAGLLYLRSVSEGGYTEFAHQNREVRPEAGKIVLFPPYWTHIHRGVTPSAEVKYVLSYFWIYPAAG